MDTRNNEVNESMISTISEAFEFEDFLGQKVTLKDRIPKNKNKTIGSFSKEVREKAMGASSLMTGDGIKIVETKSNNVFEQYIGKKMLQSNHNPESVGISKMDSEKPTQRAIYSYNSSLKTNQRKHFSKSPSFSHKRTTSYFQSKPKNQMIHSSSGKLSFGQKISFNKTKSKQRMSFENLSNPIQEIKPSYGQSIYNKPSAYSNSNNNQINNYQSDTFNFNNSYPNQSYSTIPSLSGSSSAFNLNFSSNQPSSYNIPTYSQQKHSFAAPSYNNNYYRYGEYANDFTSSDIYDILKKSNKYQPGYYTSR